MGFKKFCFFSRFNLSNEDVIWGYVYVGLNRGTDFIGKGRSQGHFSKGPE